MSERFTASRVGTFRQSRGDQFPCNRCGRRTKLNRKRGIDPASYYCASCQDVMRDLGDLPQVG